MSRSASHSDRRFSCQRNIKVSPASPAATDAGSGSAVIPACRAHSDLYDRDGSPGWVGSRPRHLRNRRRRYRSLPNLAAKRDPCANPSTEYGGLPPIDEWLRETLDIDQWGRAIAEFDSQRRAGAEGRIEGIVEIAIRAAAAATGAIEGLYAITTGQTIHVAESVGDWRSELGAVGGNSLALFEAQLRAYHTADSLAASDVGFTAAGFRQLHIELCTPQLESEPQLRVGAFKLDDNCTKKSDGTIHRYAHWGDAGPEIDRLLEVMRLPAFGDAHPVLQAAYAHLGLASIHPFDDGNGRVARAVSSALLQRSVGIPLISFTPTRKIDI